MKEFLMSNWKDMLIGGMAMMTSVAALEVVTKKLPWVKPLSEKLKKLSDALVENNNGKRL